MKAMFSIWKLWKKHVSASQATPQATYPLQQQQTFRPENHKNRTRNRAHSCQCTRHCFENGQLKRSASVNTLLEYKAGKSDWVVYGFV